jgi:hypothetical protein
MELVTGGVVCTEAFKAVTSMQDKITTLKVIDERLEQTQQDIEENDQTTTNGVF